MSRTNETPESDLKNTVTEYLQIQMNQGHLYFDRLNSGKLLAQYNGKYRMIKLCREGTADFKVLKGYSDPDGERHCNVIYLETKAESKQSDDQKEFQQLVESQNALYFIVHDVDELEQILK